MSVSKKEKEKAVLDTLIYLCGLFVIVGSIWLGYLGVGGHWKDQRILGLCVAYGSLIFLVTGAFFYFLQRLRHEPPRIQSEPPSVRVADMMISESIPRYGGTVRFNLINGRVAARLRMVSRADVGAHDILEDEQYSATLWLPEFDI